MSIVLAMLRENDAASTLRSILEPGHEVTTITSWQEGLLLHSRRRHDFTFVDLALLGLKGNEEQEHFNQVFKPFFTAFPTSQIIAMTPAADTRNAVGAVKAGVADFITFPLVPAEIHLVLERVEERLRRSRELEMLRDEFWREDTQNLVRSSSPAMKEVMAKVRKVAGTRLAVLITGETGTGKSILAKLIHLHSPRRDRQFIAVHCGTIPDTLIASELFGHEKGSFTGADRRKLGRFEVAHEGTVFLDEIGTVSPAVQVKLLQVLQDGTFRRMGGEKEQSADLRVIAATNSDLKALSRQGAFREDLFFRLNVFPIHMPPLRERREDIPFLVGQFITKHNARHGTSITGASEDVIRALQDYPWPGNIRELEHLVERACVLEGGSILGTSSFPAEVVPSENPAPRPSVDPALTLSATRERAVLSAEKPYLTSLLERHRGRISLAAAEAGITPRQLHNLMKRHHLRKETFKPPRP